MTRAWKAISLLALAASAGRGALPEAPSPAVGEVAALLPGTYVSRDPSASIRFRVASVPKSRLADGAVFYAEAVKSGRPDAPFLQRFWRLEAEGPRVVVRVYEPRDLAGVRGKWREPESLALFTPRDVRERPDCRVALSKLPAGHWAGGTAGATCFSAAAERAVAISMSLSPQSLEWREEGRDASGKVVYGPAGEITIYAREREETAPAPAAAAPPPAASRAPVAPAVAAPGTGGASRDGGSSSKVNEPAAKATALLEVTSPSSPSRKHGISELRDLTGTDRVPLSVLLSSLVAGPDAPATVVIVTSRTGGVSVFSSAEISSSGGPSLDVSGAAPRLVAEPGRGLEDVVSVEVRVLGAGR